MTRNFDTPTGTERAGAVTIAPVKCVATVSFSLRSYCSRRSAQRVSQSFAVHS
jgi:hypothetical protein